MKSINFKSAIKSHRKLFCNLSKFYNSIKLNNKLHAKGCKVKLGVNIIKGLKIISDGIDNEVFIGDYVKINKSKIILRGSNNKIVINDHSALNQVELYTEGNNNEISIGTNTRLCGKAHFAAVEGTKIVIGDNCLFSGDLHFRTGDSHSVINKQGERINQSEDIIISNHVWVGTKVTCLKGVRVAEDSIVAATTTLCKKYNTPNSIIAGVPGRIVKTDINWTHERL